MEKEVFSDCGSWKNFRDLEECLTLEELSDLFNMTVEKQNRTAKLLAAMNGIDMEEDSSVESSTGERIPLSSEALNSHIAIRGKEDLVGLGYGLGYQQG